jgi:hypothetical protein
MDQQLPTQMLPAVSHFTFSIFNVAIPNLIMWAIVVVLFFAGAWSRLPRLFERPDRAKSGPATAPQVEDPQSPGRPGGPEEGGHA